MKKQCKKCNVKLVIGDNWRESSKKYSFYICKSCAVKRNNKYLKKNYSKNRDRILANNKKLIDSHKDGLYHVYVVDNYAGQTTNVWQRKVTHKSRFKRNTDTFRVLYSTPDKTEALELEALLHDLGYEGRHTKRDAKYRT